MKARLFTVVAALALVCVAACSSEPEGPHWTQLRAPPGDVLYGLAFTPDDTPIMTTDFGYFRLDGEVWSPIAPQPPADTRTGPLVIGDDGTFYINAKRLAPGAAAWEDLNDPGFSIPEGVTPVPASDGSLYVFAQPPADPTATTPPPEKGTVYARARGARSWTAAGEVDGRPQAILPDKKGAVWIEVYGRLFVLRNGVMSFVMRSTGLSYVEDDGTLLYIFDNYQVGPVVARTEAGEERVISRGRCEESCPPDAVANRGVFGVGSAYSPSGRIYMGWKAQNSASLPLYVMTLDPGASAWRLATGAGVKALSFRLDHHERAWAFTNDFVGAVDISKANGGYTSNVFTYIWRLDGQ